MRHLDKSRRHIFDFSDIFWRRKGAAVGTAVGMVGALSRKKIICQNRENAGPAMELIQWVVHTYMYGDLDIMIMEK